MLPFAACGRRTPRAARRRAGGRGGLAVVLVLALVGLAGPAAAQAVVMAATAPGFAPGQAVAPDREIDIPADTALDLLLSSGQVVRLAGPYRGKGLPEAPAGAATGAGRLARLDLAGLDLSALGGARGGGESGAQALGGGPVRVDATRSASVCLGPESAPVLTRPDPSRAARLALADGPGVVAEVAFAAGQAEADWPRALPLTDGQTYALRWQGGRDMLSLTIRRLDPQPGPPLAVLARALLAGCKEQAAGQASAVVEALPLELVLSRQPGSPVTVAAQPSKPAFLYCWAEVNNGLVPVFPGAAQRIARVDGRALLGLPPRAGALRCYATAANMARELPAPLFAAGRALAPSQADSVAPSFHALPEGQVAEARVALGGE